MPGEVMSGTVMHPRQEELRRRLMALGFDEVAFARIAEAEASALREWLAAGHHADMAWMERTADRRRDPALVLTGAQSIIMLGVNYWPGPEESGSARPVWARYARYEDYHDTIKRALGSAGRLLEELYGGSGGDYRYYVDTGPVMERGWAERSGIGFLGKNGMLISRRHGNWLLLAAILTRIDLAPDAPMPRPGPATDGRPGRSRVGLLCGKCTRCIAVCPTQAIPRPGVVDARRCIAYQTVENRGNIPRELRPGIGDHVFGCDLCLEVCPWNRFARKGRQVLLAARPEMTALSLGELLELTPERFAALFRRTPVKRLKLAGLLRNACVVAGNLAVGAGRSHPWIIPLMRLTAHPSPVVRVHAVWAVGRIAGSAATGLLDSVRATETDPDVLAEHAAWRRAAPATGTGPASAR